MVLADCLPSNHTLTSLGLRKNAITDRGADALATALKSAAQLYAKQQAEAAAAVAAADAERESTTSDYANNRSSGGGGGRGGGIGVMNNSIKVSALVCIDIKFNSVR